MRASLPLHRLLPLAALAAALACHDASSPTGLQDRAAALVQRAAQPHAEATSIAVIGRLEEARGTTLLVRQEGPTLPEGTPPGRVQLPLGAVGDLIEVRTDTATALFVAGVRVTLPSLAPGMRLVASGTAAGTGLALQAARVSELGALAEPTEAVRTALRPRLDTTTSVERAVSAPAPGAAICASQDFDYDDGVDEFQGCWGGPSATGSYDNPDWPLSCGILGCFVLERVSWTIALAGWSFAFPYRFSAAGDLVYHVPGPVTLGLEALPATTGAFTFGGGLGVDFGFTLSFCWIVGGCDALGTYHISPFSTAHQATDEAPFSGQVMEIAEVGCPTIPVVPLLPGLDVLGLGLCEDLALEGAPFATTVRTTNASPPASAALEFDGAPASLTVRPNATTASVTFDTFEYIPTLTMGFYFRVKVLGVKIFDTPAIPLADGPFEAVTTPFPRAGSGFSENVPQPTSRTFVLEVDPAPTTLTILPPSALPQGTPLRVRLAEAYDDSPIAGEPVTLTAAGEGEVLALLATTGPDGVAAFVLPNGQYLVRAAYAGRDVYLPSESGEREVFIYQPTTFVVWGANPGGIEAGSRHLFWGNQWWKAITAGDYAGDASFKGFARPVSDTAWVSEPGSSGPPPAAVGRLIGVIVSTRVRGHGARSEGNIADWVILRVEDRRAYAPNAGHPAWGVMLRRIADPPA